LAAALSAIYGYFVLFGARIMTESFYIAAILWTLDLALALREKLAAPTWHMGRAEWVTALSLGASLGLATLLRQAALPWIAILFFWLLLVASRPARSSRDLLRRALPLLVAGLTVLAFILPFTLRNYRVFGHFLLLNSNTGYAMYSAQHPMHGADFQPFAAAPLPPAIEPHTLNEAQWDRELMARGLAFVLAEPGRYLRLSASRLLDYLEFWPTETSLLHNVGRFLSFTLFLPWFVAGFWLAARRAWRDCPHFFAFCCRPEALLFLFAAFYSLLHILTWAMPRYRLPVDAVAMPFAALALANAATLLRDHHRSHRLSESVCKA
jgi:hypothetical protein